MISDEDEDEGVVFQRLTLNNNYRSSSTDQGAHLQTGDYQEDINIQQQLAEKDHYLTLAAEAGQVLLENNQELKNHFESLQEEYLRKIEGLQQDRYHLRKALNEQGAKHDSCMQDLQREITNLGGQLQVVQKSSKAIEHSTESTYENLSGQNSSLLRELENVKSYNQALTQQVENLSGRIDQQDDAAEKVQSKWKMHDEGTHNAPITNEASSSSVNQIDYREFQGLKETLKQLIDQKDFLEESLSGLIKEKHDSGHQKVEGNVSRKMSNLEGDLSSLREQVKMCQEELHITRKKNEKLEDQLEEYVLMQSSQTGSHSNTSLFIELESSIPEVDMNFRDMSTPLKYGHDDSNDSATISHTSNIDFKIELQELYHKLCRLKNDLVTNELAKQLDLELITVDVVNNLVDEISELIRKRLVGFGSVSDPSQIEMGSCADLSLSSDPESDILKQQLHDLNRFLNTKTSELENMKKELSASQKNEVKSNDKVHELTVKLNSQEREIENLRKEREILLNNGTIDENLKKALQDRDEALARENETKAKYEVAQSDMQKLNNQLISAVQQKHDLSEQLEQWQFDMAALIDQQVNKNMRSDNQNSRKRSNKGTPSNERRSFAAKLFTSKSNK